jgi:MerR family transcriptional regulator, mercuric resistance operon regulatory protein
VNQLRYRISELAEKCGVNKETIRYYERVGLLLEPSRTNTGYRMFSEESVNRIKFIKRIQDLGFTLAEISKLLGVVDKDEERCVDMYNFVVKKIDDNQAIEADFFKLDQLPEETDPFIKNKLVELKVNLEKS